MRKHYEVHVTYKGQETKHSFLRPSSARNFARRTFSALPDAMITVISPSGKILAYNPGVDPVKPNPDFETDPKRLDTDLDQYIEKFHPKYGGVLYKASVPHVGTDFYDSLEEARKFVRNALEWMKGATHMRRLEDISYGPRKNPPGRVDYITPAAAKRLAGPMFPKLRQGFMAVGTRAGRSFRIGYVIPKGYYVEWDIADAAETDDEINARIAQLEKITSVALENPGRLTIKAGAYRGMEGFKIFGTDPRGRQVRIFTRSYLSAVNIVNKLKRGEQTTAADFQDNPKGTKIYNRVISIRASKAGMPHNCDDECRAHGHRYEHKFKEKASIFGLENGNLLVKA